MGRTKNKKNNNSLSSTTTAIPAPSAQQASIAIAASIPTTPTSEQAYTNQDFAYDQVATTIDSDSIPDLQPYLSLLPAMRGIPVSIQQTLYDALYTAGSTAAQALETYLKDKSVVLKQLEGAAMEANAEATSESEQLRLLLSYVSVEIAADNLRRACSGPDGKILLRDSDDKVLNEVAAAALSAFSYAASRRPSTKHVEYLMNPTASADGAEETGSQASQTLSALAESKLQVSLSEVPYQRCFNTSTGTNGSFGLGNPFGMLTNKAIRKRSVQRRLQDPDEELLSEDDDIEDDELEDEDEISDVDDIDEENSEPLTDLMDESRRTDSPVDDYDNTDALLRFACTVGHVEIVKALIKIRGSPNYFCIRKSTMLMEACCAGQHEIVRVLLDAGADINAVSASRNTPLIYASTAGKLECVLELLEHSNIVVDARNTSGHTALMEASSAGHLRIVKELLKAGANIYAIVENVDFKESSLSLASYRGHVDVVKCLLENMQDCTEKVDELHTGLLEAAMDGHVEVARVLLENGALVNLPTENFESPLTLAACGGHYELVKLLLDCNADIEETNDESYTPLMEAAREGHRDVVELLLNYGANVNSKIEEGIETPLTLAASGGYLNVVQLLVSRGGNLSLGERTPLYEATQEGHADVADYIMKQLKETEKQEVVLEDLNNSLVCAAETNNMGLVNMFLENGADKDCFSKDGRTPLMEAARQGHVNMIEFLLKCGADINKISPNNDATALSLACLFGHSDAVQFLLDNGANPEVSLKDSVSCIIEASRNGNTDCARIVLDYIGSKSKEKPQDEIEQINAANAEQVPTSTAAEIFSRPKIKPVSKLNKDSNTTVINSMTGLPYSPIQFNQPTSLFPTLGDSETARTLRQEYGILSHTLSPELLAAAAASLEPGVLPNGILGQTALQKQGEKLKRSTASTNTFNKFSQQQTDDNKLNELLQQLPGDLVNAMLAATTTSNTTVNASSTIADESMLAHFLQRALVEPKRRNAAWTNEELSAFKEMIRQKVRQLPAATAQNALPNTLIAHQDATTIAQQQHELMMANMLGECPGCAHHNHASSNYTANMLHGFQHGETTSLMQSNASLKRKGATTKTNSRTSSVASAECAGSFGSRQVNSVKQKLAETSELLRSKLDGIQLTNDADETLQELRKLNAQQQQQKQPLASPVQSSPSVIQTSMYLNRLNNSNNSTTLTAEQQQQILFYQQQEIHNLQNLQTAAGHHHVGSTTTVPHAGAVACHQSHHGLNQQMNCLAQLHHGSGRMARRTGQAIGSSAASKQLCSGKHMERRANPSLSAPPPAINDSKVSSYVDMQTETNSDTALTVACVGGHAPLVSLLIQRGANVEHRDKKGFTPLILAATGGHVECCKLLLDAQCQIDAVSERTKDTALSLACSSGRKEVVELLLRFNANKEHRNVSDYTPLSLAASGGFVEIIHLLLDAGAEINSRTGSKLGISPLMLAAMNGHDQATKLLLDRGSDINAQIETNRNTALTLACFQGRTEVVRLLLDHNANVEHRAKTGLTPLMEAANGGFTDVGSLLLKCNADPNAPPVPSSRDTALTIAADKGHSAFVAMLLENNAAIDIKNKKGCTPLFLACSNGHLETVKILVENHADVDALDNRKTSPLVAAFRKGFVKVVEFMVQHVSQFPNDQECQRFCSTLQDSDVAMKVKNCFNVIVDAKAKQAEQANLAAQSLLEQLAEEEALAESKKLSKKRLKEKKRARKLAKKQLESEDLIVTDEQAEELADDEPDAEPESKSAALSSQFTKMDTFKQKKQKKTFAKDQQTLNILPLVKESSPDIESLTVVADESRVPVVPDMQAAVMQQESGTLPTQTNHSKGVQRRQNRGRRSELGGNVARISVYSNTTVASPQHSPNVGVATTAAIPNKSFNDESEWCSAGKKRASSRPAKEPPMTTAAISSRDVYHDLIALMNENSQVTDAWTLTESNGKRRAFAVNVNSGTVARIIGRAGQNINAIREATNAHIEVEKIATRREQTARQITVKGSHDAIRSAIQMIDLLIRENDTHVTDIIQRILSASGNNTSPVNSSSMPVQLPSVVTLDKSPKAQTFSSYNSSNVSKQINAASRQAQTTVTPATNVWQQRAAIRKLQQSTDDSNMQQQQTFVGNPRPPSSTFSGSTSASISPVPAASYPVTVSTTTAMATTTLAQHDYLMSHRVSPVNNVDELKRKAPGFERPINSGTANVQATPNKAEIAKPEEISMLFAGASENSMFVSSSQQQRLDNTILSSILNETQQSPNSNSFGDPVLVPSNPLSHLAVGSQRHQNNSSAQAQRSQRPLSEIWDNTGSSALNNPNNQSTTLGDFNGLFGSGVLDPKSLWLPQTTKNNSLKNSIIVTNASNLTARDDHWLESDTSLFGSLGLNNFNSSASTVTTSAASMFSVPKSVNSTMIGSGLSAVRSHSSTDWTANVSSNTGTPWSNGLLHQPPTNAQRLSFNNQWVAGSMSSSTGVGDVISSPKITQSTWSAVTTTPQNFRTSRSLLPSTIGSAPRQNPIGQPPASASPVSSNVPAGNWNQMDVFNLIAAQVKNVDEKQKRAQQAANSTASPSINNVYAAYNTGSHPIQVMRNRATQNMTPPNVQSFAGNVTWSGQPAVLNNNPGPSSSVFSTANKTFQVGNPNGSVSSQQQTQWNAWNY